MKKVIFVLIMLLSFTLFVSCSSENDDVDSSSTSQTQNTFSSPLEENIKEDVSNLPTHLYQTTEMRTASSLQYDFEIKEPTSLQINVSTMDGKLSIGVKNLETDTFVLELTECTKEEFNQVTTLEDTGRYSIVLKASNYTGSYEVVGTPMEQ